MEKNNINSRQFRNGNLFLENDSDGTVTEEVGEGGHLRWKMFFHVTICFPFFNMGFSDGMRGPPFEDLMMITGVSYGKGSAFLSVCYVGVIVGSVLCGYIIDRYNKTLVMAGAALFYGCTTALIPLCSYYWAMVLVHGLQGTCHGMLTTGCFTACGQLWTESSKSASYIHSMQLCAPMDSIIAPLVITPFLSSDPPTETPMINKTSVHNVTMIISSSTIQSEDHNQTYMYNNVIQAENATIHVQRAEYKEQRLIIPYSFSGIMFVITMVFFLVLFCRKVNTSAEKRRNTNIQLEIRENKQHLSIYTKILRFYLVGVLAFFAKSTETSFTLFFPAFLHTKMRWDKTLSSDIMAVFWGVFAFGRLSGICMSFRVKSTTHLFLDITVLIISFIVLLMGTLFSLDELLWLSMICLAVGFSTLSPCLVSWIQTDILSRRGLHNSYYVVSYSLGIVLVHLIIGHLVEIDYTRFVYVLLTGCVIFMVHHIWLFLFLRTKLNKHNCPNGITINVSDQK